MKLMMIVILLLSLGVVAQGQDFVYPRGTVQPSLVTDTLNANIPRVAITGGFATAGEGDSIDVTIVGIDETWWVSVTYAMDGAADERINADWYSPAWIVTEADRLTILANNTRRVQYIAIRP